MTERFDPIPPVKYPFSSHEEEKAAWAEHDKQERSHKVIKLLKEPSTEATLEIDRLLKDVSAPGATVPFRPRSDFTEEAAQQLVKVGHKFPVATL